MVCSHSGISRHGGRNMTQKFRIPASLDVVNIPEQCHFSLNSLFKYEKVFKLTFIALNLMFCGVLITILLFLPLVTSRGRMYDLLGKGPVIDLVIPKLSLFLTDEVLCCVGSVLWVFVLLHNKLV